MVRLIRPAYEFYRDVLQIWVSENVKGKPLDFISFKLRVKHFYGKDFNDEWSIPLYEVFRVLSHVISKVQ